jgi:hypothetical protein
MGWHTTLLFVRVKYILHGLFPFIPPTIYEVGNTGFDFFPLGEFDVLFLIASIENGTNK